MSIQIHAVGRQAMIKAYDMAGHSFAWYSGDVVFMSKERSCLVNLSTGAAFFHDAVKTYCTWNVKPFEDGESIQAWQRS